MPRTQIPPARRTRTVSCVAASQICTVTRGARPTALELALGLSWKICGCAQEGYRAARLCVCNTQKKPPAPQESPRRVEVAHTTHKQFAFALNRTQIKPSAKVADGLRSISKKGHARPLRRICCQIYKKVAPGSSPLMFHKSKRLEDRGSVSIVYITSKKGKRPKRVGHVLRQ